MLIRPLMPEDRAQWNPLWQGYLDFYEAKIGAEITELTWMRLTDPAPKISGLGAFREARLVGFTHYLFHPSTWSDGPYCYLEDLFVDPEARGHGVGGALIEAVGEAARKAGASQLYWLTQETNRQAINLYNRVSTRSGFIHYQRKLS